MTFETDMEELLERMRSLIHLQREGEISAVDFLITYRELMSEMQEIDRKYDTLINAAGKT
jgi:hypothetical protein